MWSTDSQRGWVPALIAGLVLSLTMGSIAAQPASAAPAPTAGPPPIALTDLQGGGRRVALTFDDGPDPSFTPAVLAVLARYRAVATFCMVGARVQQYPDLVRRVAGAGMRICSHSRTHDLRLGTRPRDQIVAEVTDLQRRLGPGITVRYFRAPGGNWTPTLLAVAAQQGLQPLGWSVDPRDWRRPGAPAIVGAIQRQVHPGAIVLMHDGGGPRDQTVAALQQVLPWLNAQGYGFTFPTT